MKKDEIFILKDRGLISISGPDAFDFLQNIVTNDIKKVNKSKSIFSGIFTPQGKYLYEFFIIKSTDGYYLDCDNTLTEELINYLSKYKLNSEIEIKNLSSDYVVGAINIDKFSEIKKITREKGENFYYRESAIFIDPRSEKLGARILSSLEKLYLTIKKLNLTIVDSEDYLKIAHINGIPIKGLNNLKDQLFGLEANFEEFKAIDFKKGCYIGQENTARMKLKNKLRKRLFPIKTDLELKIGDEIIFNKNIIGKILISGPFPFALIKLFDPDFSKFKDQEVLINDKKVKIINSYLYSL